MPSFFFATKAGTESTPAFAGRGSRRRSNGRLTHWTSVRKGTSQGLDFRPSTINGRTPSIVLGPKVLAGARNPPLTVVGNDYDRQGAQPILALATAFLLWTLIPTTRSNLAQFGTRPLRVVTERFPD